MLDGYQVVDLRRQSKPLSLKSVFDEIQLMSKGITFLYEDDIYSTNDHIEDLNKIGKCLKDEGRDYVVYHYTNEAEEEISNNITEVEMQNWLRDPKDKDLVTTMQMARGWEASTSVLIANHFHADLGNLMMRAVTKGRKVKKEFTVLNLKLKMENLF